MTTPLRWMLLVVMGCVGTLTAVFLGSMVGCRATPPLESTGEVAAASGAPLVSDEPAQQDGPVPLTGAETSSAPPSGDSPLGAHRDPQDTALSTPIDHWLEMLKASSGKHVSSAYFQGEQPTINLVDTQVPTDYAVIRAILESNGYDVTEDLRSDLIRVRHARNRVRKRISEVPTSEEEVNAPELVTWVRYIQHLDVESTFDTVRQLMRVRRTRDIGSGVFSLRVEMVIGQHALVVTGDPSNLYKVKRIIERVDTPYAGKHPLFYSYALHNCSVEEMTERLETMADIPYEVIHTDEDTGEVDIVSSTGIDDIDRKKRFARILGLPGIRKIVLETNAIATVELVSNLVALLDKRDPVLRDNTFVYRAQHKPVATLELYLRQFIGGGGVPPLDGGDDSERLINTRIVGHDLANVVIIQTAQRRYDYMLQYMQSIDQPRELPEENR